MKIHCFIRVVALSGLLLIAASCGKDGVTSGPVQFVFKHNINGVELQRGIMKYTNKAGNIYQVDELQYFISEIKLTRADGQIIAITADSSIHYVDLDVAGTEIWNSKVLISVEDYTSISFVFGINEAKNKTGLFVNPPQRDMFWPDIMGGGYHYMKMNGKWKANADTIKPFNFHLGIGMKMPGPGFVQNYFTVTQPLNIHTGSSTNVFTVTMNIEKWFESPNVWDWNVIGGQIMMNQMAMHKACENGVNAFHVSFEGSNPE